VDEVGLPLAGATLIATPQFLPYEDCKLRLVASEGQVAHWTRRIGTTDATGCVRLLGLVCGPSPEGGVPVLCDLQVLAPGHRGDRRTVQLQPGDNEELFVLPIGEQAVVRGRVLAANDMPIIEARVNGGVLSDAAGCFECPTVNLKSGRLDLQVVAGGFLTLQHSEPVAGRVGDFSVTLTMLPAGRVRGVVRDQFGSPILGARNEGVEGDHQTAIDGTFELPEVDLRPLQLRVVPPYADLVFEAAVEFIADPAQRERVSITLRRRIRHSRR
ncbi:MAG: carboxypeptidase-like regulatory domain-containing protein, partial [Planctomycetota bacterium]